MSLPLKWSVKNCASTLYACGFQLEQREMISNKPNGEKNISKDKKIKTKIPAKIDGDQDFIVFKFNEDGEIDLVKEKLPPRNQDRAKDGTHRSHKVSKKLAFGGSSKGLEFKVSEDGTMISDNEAGETSNRSSSKKLSHEKGGSDEIKVITPTEENAEPKTLMSESTRSDSSAGSFAFPVITMEMVGSPERMPKSGEQNKIERMLRFPCCNF